MKKLVLLALAGVVASMVISATSGTAASGCPIPPHTPRLTIKFLKIIDRPVRAGYRACDLASGTIWDGYFPARPGERHTMVIDGHDVTPVPGYSHDRTTGEPHGPFYYLNEIKPGMMVKIKSKGVVYHYRFISKPRTYVQCLHFKWRYNKHTKKWVKECDRYNNSFIKRHVGERIYFRCCWPRYTHNEYMVAVAQLVHPKHWS